MDTFLAFTLKSNGILDMLKTDTLINSNIRDKSKNIDASKNGVAYGIQGLPNHLLIRESLTN